MTSLYTERMKNKKSFEEIMNEYKELSDMMKRIVRNTAILSLKTWDVPEIGTSDINCEIVSLYNSYGSFDGICRQGLELV